jgi:hypothetical protein
MGLSRKQALIVTSICLVMLGLGVWVGNSIAVSDPERCAQILGYDLQG